MNDMTTPTTGSNSLADLAVRIDASHCEVVAAAESTLTHAMAAGDMLLEAKAKVGHGGWLSWLKENTSVPPRTASHYMRLAKRRDEIGKDVADLTVTDALTLLAPPRIEMPERWDGTPEGLDEIGAWVVQQLEEPFTDWDFEAGHTWLFTKIMHVAKVPDLVSLGLSERLASDYDDSLMALCSYDDLVEAIKIMLPWTKHQDGASNVKMECTSPLAAAVKIKYSASALLGGMLREFELRGKTTDAKYAARFEAALAALGKPD